MDAVAQDYLSREDRVAIFAPDKAEREELNRLIRSDLYEHSRLGETFSVVVLADRMLSNKDAKVAANNEVGDVIRYGSKGSDELGIPPNTNAKVTGIEPKRTSSPSPARTTAPRLQAFDRVADAPQIDPLRHRGRELAEGERIQFTRSEWDRGIRAGNLATIEQIQEDGGLSVKLDSGASSPPNKRNIWSTVMPSSRPNAWPSIESS